MSAITGSASAEFDFDALEREVGPQRIKPLAALLAMMRLIRDPEDTQQVALMGIALAGRSQHDIFRRFVSYPAGQAVIREKRELSKTLDNHEYLRTLPENSLGRHYLAFMEREGLSAQGLIDATPAATEKTNEFPEPIRLFANYTGRDMHDMYHILTGYGRDELGEICVLAMSYEQLKIRAFKLIALVGPDVVRRRLREAGINVSGVREAVREAGRIGRAAGWIPSQDIEGILGEDLDALRVRLNIGRPVLYERVIANIRAALPDWNSGPLAGRLDGLKA